MPDFSPTDLKADRNSVIIGSGPLFFFLVKETSPAKIIVFYFSWMVSARSQLASVCSYNTCFSFFVGLIKKNESSHPSSDPASCCCGPLPESCVEERLR